MTKRKDTFADFSTYVRLHDGTNKPKINFQDMYKMFPQFSFVGNESFGSYCNFGDAYEAKIYNMTIEDANGNECIMVYKEYCDANENLAYTTVCGRGAKYD